MINGLSLQISFTQCDFLIDHLEYINYARPVAHQKNEDATRNALIGHGLIKYDTAHLFDGRTKVSTVLTESGHDVIGKVLEHYINNLVRAGMRQVRIFKPMHEKSDGSRPTQSP